MEILVVDDNRATRKMVRFALERRGHRVMEAATAHIATCAVERSVPDLILQDLRLPNEDCFALADSLRILTNGAVPIVAFSDDLISVASIRSSGFDGAISKPIQPARLVEQVETHLLRKRAQSAASRTASVMPARPSLHAALFVTPGSQLAQRCAELTSQLAIVEGMTAAVLEEPDVDSLLGELLTAWFNAGGLSGGALFLKSPESPEEPLSVRCLGAWQGFEKIAASFFGDYSQLETALTTGDEVRLLGSELAGKSVPGGVEGQEVIIIPIRSGDTIFGALAAASVGNSWTAWQQLTRSVAQRIAQLCVHQRMRHEQEVTEENARRQAALMTALIQNAPDVIAHLDCDGVVQFVNRSLKSDAQLVGSSFFDFVRPLERERVRGIMAQVVKSGEPITYEIEATGSTENPSWWSCRMGPVRENGSVVGVVLICRDISNDRAIEARLRVSDRLAAIGTLAAGVAHEINTPIQYVANNLDFVVACVKAITESEPKTRGMTREFALERLPTALADCEDGVKRVAAITHAMRTFSHPGSRYEQVDLNEGLEATVELTRHEWKDISDITLNLDAELPLINGSRAELNQAFLNLVINAGHAIDDARKADGRRGNISITTRIDDNSHVVVEIGDNGCGIPLAARSRVYDLFFTTKEVGRGSGQGLALAHSIAEAHGGTISFETKENVGTTFLLRLPLDGPSEPESEPRS